jgi:hypothetical protein
MFTDDPNDATGRPTSPFPNNPQAGQTIIRLGTVSLTGQNVEEIQQYQIGNMLNRYVPLAPVDSPLAAPQSLRGAWVADNLINQAFYKGDMVIDDTAPKVVISGTKFYNVYIYTNNFGKGAVNPGADSGNWRAISTVILP